MVMTCRSSPAGIFALFASESLIKPQYFQPSSPGLTRGSSAALTEMPTDQVRGLKAHGSSPAMTIAKARSTAPTIEFVDVHFAYPRGRGAAHDGLSFSVAAGEK